MKLKAVLRGVARSWTMWLAALTASSGVIEANFHILQPLFAKHPEWFGYTTAIMGMAFAVLRAKTVESLHAKGEAGTPAALESAARDHTGTDDVQ